ncbi:hypothetical protein ID866_11172 [Astraeus odoratus]|nr:hypothetical protein ID866_11172 [Astraeus odoratus]
MSHFSSLLIAALFVFYVRATPIEASGSPITLPFAKRISMGGGTIRLLEHDQVRAAALRDRGKNNIGGGVDRRAANVPVANAVVSYIASVGIGTPPTYYDLIVDTGSSNTWVGAGKPYKKTSSSYVTSNSVSVSYGSGSFFGTEYYDAVTLGSGLTIPKQSIGVASSSTGFDGVDGILGIGPVDLTLGTLSPDEHLTIPTVTDNLLAQNTIPQEVIGISFQPTDSLFEVNGELTFGGVDTNKFTGSISYVPITTTSPSAYYWGIDQSIAYGSTTILSQTAGIVDTGTTMILIATDAFIKYKELTGSVVDSNTGLLRITPSQYSSLKNLNFIIGGKTYALTPNGQIWPRSLNTAIGGSTSYVYLMVADSQTDSGSGLDFTNGQAFHERFYVVYDADNSRVGFATTPYTDATAN